MDAERFKCKRCGGFKTLFFVRGPIRVVITFVGLVALYIVGFVVISDFGLRVAVMFAGAVLVALPVLTLFRYRCLSCEPEWRQRVWGKL